MAGGSEVHVPAQGRSIGQMAAQAQQQRGGACCRLQAPHYGYTGADDPAARDVVEWEQPVQALNREVTDGSADVLTPEQIETWHSERYLVISGIWPAELIAVAAAQFEAIYPTPSAEISAEELLERGPAHDVGGFPWGPHLSAANIVAVHPRILRAVMASRWRQRAVAAPFHESRASMPAGVP